MHHMMYANFVHVCVMQSVILAMQAFVVLLIRSILRVRHFIFGNSRPFREQKAQEQSFLLDVRFVVHFAKTLRYLKKVLG